MRSGVQVSFRERNPTRDTGTVQSVCGFDINTKYQYRWGHMDFCTALNLSCMKVL